MQFDAEMVQGLEGAPDSLVQRVLRGKAALLHATLEVGEVAQRRAECGRDPFCLPGLPPAAVHALDSGAAQPCAV